MLHAAAGSAGRRYWVAGALLTVAWLAIYLTTVSPTVNFIDSGELITALHEPGIVHPPGYPLYTLLGYVVSHVPVGEVAWRVNVLSSLAGAAAVGAFFFLICAAIDYSRWLTRTKPAPQPEQRRKASRSIRPAPVKAADEAILVATSSETWPGILCGLAGASLFAASSTFWNRTTQAKMYTLHYMFVALILWLAVETRWALDRGGPKSGRRPFITLCAVLGLSFTNHLMTALLVLPLVTLLLVGRGWRERASALVTSWRLAISAFLVPLLLYAYLPIRSSQGPIMNWGSPDTLADFWRHISGWQYGAYVATDMSANVGRLGGYISAQWSWLTLLVLAGAILAGAVLARTNLVLFASTLLLAALTFFVGLAYEISEIEPYLVPLYMVLVLWLTCAPALLDRALPGTAGVTADARASGLPRASLIGGGVLAVVAIGTLVLQYPAENHSNDHLAELFAQNAFSSMEKNSIVITDHWDFVSPSYYLQLVQNQRPDLVLVDKSLLRYPWYLGQLEKRYPWLIANSRDIVNTYSSEQRKWVNGEPFDSNLINQSYIALLTSFVERNYDKHPAYVLFSQGCDPQLPPDACENNQIAAGYARQPAGLAYRLWKTPPPAGALPPIPNFDLQGFTSDRTPLDEFARFNAGLYLDAYAVTAQAYASANQPDKAQALAAKRDELQAALER